MTPNFNTFNLAKTVHAHPTTETLYQIHKMAV